MLKIVCISDTHRKYHKIDIPDGDILIDAGDIGLEHYSTNEIIKYNTWLGTLPHKHKIISPGNHDLYLESFPEIGSLITNGKLLIDDFIIIDGVKFYASPWQPEFFDWAWNLPRKSLAIVKKWAQIPDDTNVLITHGPPSGILDTIRPGGENIGCECLLKRIHELKKLQLHVFGHIHGGYGIETDTDRQITFVNASICTEKYKPTNKPIIIELKKGIAP